MKKNYFFNLVCAIATGLGGVWMFNVADSTNQPWIFVAIGLFACIVCLRFTIIILLDLAEESAKMNDKGE